jgi:hypothetical protein
MGPQFFGETRESLPSSVEFGRCVSVSVTSLCDVTGWCFRPLRRGFTFFSVFIQFFWCSLMKTHGCRGQWEELADWVTETYPWKMRSGAVNQQQQKQPSSLFSDSHAHTSSSLRQPVSGGGGGGGGSGSYSAAFSLPLLRLRPEDVGYGGSGASVSGTLASRRTATAMTVLQPPPTIVDEPDAEDGDELDPLVRKHFFQN